jgi:hypothetical protein
MARWQSAGVNLSIMSEEAEPRERNELSLANALAKGTSIRAWARANDVPKSTAIHWAKEPEVRAEIEAFRRRAIDQAVGAFAGHAAWAAKGICALAEGAESESVKLRAMRAIFADMMAVSRYSGLEERMAELEAHVREQRGGGASQPSGFPS